MGRRTTLGLICPNLPHHHRPHPPNRYKTWAALPWRVKRRFFSTWLLLICLGTALALASATLNLAQRQNYAPSLLSHKACAGAACFLLWASALRYLEPFPKLYALVPVVNAAVARLVPFLAGFLPIFVGYALLGMACFGRGTATFATFAHVMLHFYFTLLSFFRDSPAHIRYTMSQSII